MDELNSYLVKAFTKSPESLFLKKKKEFFYNSYNYKDSYEYVRKIISFLRAKNISKGDRILIWGPNGPEWALLFLAAIMEGVVVVPANMLSSADLIAKYFEQVEPKIIFRSQALPPFKESGNLAQHQVVEEIVLEYVFDLVRDYEEAEIRSDLKGDDLLEILYTSGTTGEPKGVMLSRRNMFAEVEVLTEKISIPDRSRLVSLLPYSHIYEQVISLLYPIQFSHQIFYVSRLTPKNINEAFKEYRPTHLVLVPQAMKNLLNKIVYRFEQKNLGWLFRAMSRFTRGLPKPLRRIIFYPVIKEFGGKLDLVTLGGAKTDKDVQQAFQSFGVDVIEGYGLTETAAAVTMNIPSKNYIGTSGKPIQGVDIQLTPEGEIKIKGDVVFKGYFKRPELNSEVFDADGYFLTGDVASFDDNGNLVLKGRQKFRIVLPSGEKVYPEDIEYRLKQHSQIKDVCIFGYGDTDNKQVAAAIIPKHRDNFDIAAVVHSVNENLEFSQKIQQYVVWPEDDFPMTSTLKVIRNEVEAVCIKILTGSNEVKPQATKELELKNSIAKSVTKLLALVCSVSEESITADKKLVKDFGVDSLKRLSILTLIEDELDKIISESQINEETTVEDLIKIITAAPITKRKKIKLGWQFSNHVWFLRKIFNKNVAAPLIDINIDLEVIGDLSKIPDQAIVVANHPGIYDYFFIQKLFLDRNKKYFTLADDAHWSAKKRFINGFFLEFFGASIPIDKTGNNVQHALAVTGKLLDKGYSLVFSPNGDYTYSDNDIRDMKGGSSYIIKSTDLPILPCFFEEKYTKILHPDRPNKYMPRRVEDDDVKLVVGEPMYIPSYLSDAEANKMISDAIIALRSRINTEASPESEEDEPLGQGLNIEAAN